MSTSAFASPRDEIVDTMINLTHLSRSHRIVVAGGASVELYLALRRRGFSFSALVSSRTPAARYSAALIAGDRSYQEIEATIGQIGRLLCPAADLTISIASQETGLATRVRTRLQQSGFRIEAGARCQEGFVLAAHREQAVEQFGVIANVA